uniref:Large ribosomal subunit protein uL22c n=1 Tax=Adonis amurensis TaxID=196574 RepID=A0A7T3QNT4_9MAGN|nr:ribosomal protein L22 [Adonis amurensis]YP_010719232.1 ribosomal protein L22 [Adonis ramosa]QPZ75866.1 ribosomal protein L22 [Adonis amurensis]WDR47281.1 ribosomal protein L22 [Adonis ramosa]
MIKSDPNGEVYALGQHIRMSAHKARRVIDQIRGRPYEETLMILELMPYRACYPIFKLVYSAAANARHNMGFNETALIISQAEVNEGTIMKKLKPRARGRSYAIKRPTCHITIVLQDISKDKNYFIWLRKYGWVYKDKYTDVRERYRYLYMMDHMLYGNRMTWANRDSEVLWDKK